MTTNVYDRLSNFIRSDDNIGHDALDDISQEVNKLLEALKQIMNYSDNSPLAAKHMAAIAKQAIVATGV